MRRTLVGVVAAGLVAGFFGTTAPASAECDPVMYELTGSCTNECQVLSKAYKAATGRDPFWECTM